MHSVTFSGNLAELITYSAGLFQLTTFVCWINIFVLTMKKTVNAQVSSSGKKPAGQTTRLQPANDLRKQVASLRSYFHREIQPRPKSGSQNRTTASKALNTTTTWNLASPEKSKVKPSRSAVKKLSTIAISSPNRKGEHMRYDMAITTEPSARQDPKTQLVSCLSFRKLLNDLSVTRGHTQEETKPHLRQSISMTNKTFRIPLVGVPTLPSSRRDDTLLLGCHSPMNAAGHAMSPSNLTRLIPFSPDAKVQLHFHVEFDPFLGKFE